MRLTRLTLENYRVYEGHLELELPPGLVGIFGPNGAGKSYLVESVRWALFGKSRTTNDDVRTSGVGADCVTAVEFEHEGHLYEVRRTISGINSTVRAEALADGSQVAEGVSDVTRYVHSILGMDDTAFRASVFAEQKQLAAFSNQSPGKRRDLVLRLLGITPLDRARDDARRHAREARDDHERLRTLLPVVADLEKALEEAEARASEAATAMAGATEAAAVATAARDEAEVACQRLDDLRRAHDELVAEGKTVAAELKGAEEQVGRLEEELRALAGAAGELEMLRPEAERFPETEERLRLVRAVVRAGEALAALPEVKAPPEPDEDASARAAEEAATAGAVRASVEGELRAAVSERDRAAVTATESSELSDEEACPLCGQELGDAFEQVRAHRQAELAGAEKRVKALHKQQKAVAKQAADAEKAAKAAAAELKRARALAEEHREISAGRRTAKAQLDQAVAELGRPVDDGEPAALATELQRIRKAADACRRLEGRLERRPAVETQLESARELVATAGGSRQALLDKVRDLGYRREDAEAARTLFTEARTRAEMAVRAQHEAEVAGTRALSDVQAATARLEDGREQHRRIGEVATNAAHLGRLGDLLNDFRNAVVATVGPRLAAQAAELFAELTDHEYDRLEVDAENYEIMIRDAGELHGMGRFSGSETDLANLALRIAISEHVRFQSGGAVGLLVLDEVFGPLDEDRKDRMLLALERLRGRFRQILVVTHAAEVKEQLPSAIEVVKLPGRRATARVLTGV